MKYFFMVALTLSLAACGGFSTKEEFLKDKENMKKYIELSEKREKSPDCEKIGQLYKFTKLESPTTDDLAEILPILGLSSKDATDIDRLYNINYSIIDKYNCTDNAKQLLDEKTAYCKDKYYDEYDLETLVYFPFMLVSFVSVMTIVGAIPFDLHPCGLDSAFHPIMCKKEQDCEYYSSQSISADGANYTDVNKNVLKEQLKAKIQGMYKLPEYTDDLLSEFKASELIKAAETVLGTYHGICSFYSGLCDSETNVVTKLNAARVLYLDCFPPYTLPWEKEEICTCYAHETYNKVTYEDVVYIAEEGRDPKSKHSEFVQIYKKCEQKAKRKRWYGKE